MKVYYDLHIHSVLSPCADDLMTPNHIVLMAKIKGLDVISVTDHNSTRNCRVIGELCEQVGLLFIPGIEVETIEGVHLLSYFESIDKAERFGKWVESHLNTVKNNQNLFGNQWVMTSRDEILEKYPWLLIQSTNLTCEDVVSHVHDLDGVVVAAHINKSSNNIIVNLGFIPKSIKLDGVELNSYIYEQGNDKISQSVLNYPCLINSDAHSLGFINEPIYYLEVEGQKSIFVVFNYLKGGE